MTIGENLKSYRKEKSLTQKTLAKKLGISTSYMSELESNKRNPSIETVNKIAEKLNISTLYLLEGKYTTEDLDTLRKNEIWEMSDWFKSNDNSNMESVIRFCVEFINNRNKYDSNSVFAIEKLFQLLNNLQDSKINNQTIKTQIENFIGVFLQNLNYMVDNKSAEELENFFKEVIAKTDSPS
ncbi:MAG: helix-turn-helix transcriptional regulator [Clostridia bacterium]|nr:helix-turn-helix transcriptional regulator [Methanobrevibacter sp.]MBR2786335.1 helix-turn-helix transcriptional regulator [Clostridia bacterium]